MRNLKVMTVVGTRPEIIRLSCVIDALNKHTDHVLVHTGQNYDHELNQVFFDDLGLRAPDVLLNADTSSLGRFLGGVLSGVEAAIDEHHPDALLVLGDTNSCIAAVMAKRKHVPVFHMEAGNRCWDLNVPEETNRRLVDHVSDINLAYTEHARRNLLAEGLHPRKVYVTGSPMHEVLLKYRDRIEASTVLQRVGLEPGKYFLVSVHREETVDAPTHLQQIIDLLGALVTKYQLPVIVSTHPRTRKRLEASGTELPTGVVFSKPYGFHDYNALQMNSRCVISDSGTISEESSMLGFAAVTPRKAIERPEALDAGAMYLGSITPTEVLRGVDLVLSQWDDGWRPNLPADYAVTDTSKRVLRIILELAPLLAEWDNLHR